MELLADIRSHIRWVIVGIVAGMICGAALGMALNNYKPQIGSWYSSATYTVKKTDTTGMVSARELVRSITKPETLAHMRAQEPFAHAAYSFDITRVDETTLSVSVSADTKSACQEGLAQVISELQNALNIYADAGNSYELISLSTTDPTQGSGFYPPHTGARLISWAAIGAICAAMLSVAAILLAKAHAQERLLWSTAR